MFRTAYGNDGELQQTVRKYGYDGTSTTEYTFNELDQLISSVVTTEDNQTTSSRTYSYDRIIDQSGVAVATYDYDEYGNIISQTGNDIDNEVCYTGQIYDESTGLYYYNARFYDPEDGIFTTQDTDRGQASEPSTLNYYAYCAGDPINNIDPSGHSFFGRLWKKVKKKARSVTRHVVRTARKVYHHSTTRTRSSRSNSITRSRYTKRPTRVQHNHRKKQIKKLQQQRKRKYKKRLRMHFSRNKYNKGTPKHRKRRKS